MCSFCIGILFSVIRQERVKDKIKCATVQRMQRYLLVCGAEVFQSKAFNRHKPINIIVFRLDLVCKTGYYTLYIIKTAQNIIKSSTTLGCISERVTTVVHYNNAYMW